MPVRFEVQTNLQQERDRLGRFVKMFEGRTYQIMVEEVWRAQEQVNMQVPVDTGRLRAGSAITLDTSEGIRKPKIVGSAEAYDPDTGIDYAPIQHDTIGFRHPNGGKPFFIRDPFNEMVNRLDRRFKEELGYE